MKRITIVEIAQKANVSVSTVSRVINKSEKGVSSAKRQEILQIIEACGYEPDPIAKSLITKKSKLIGLVIPDIANPFYPLLAKGVEAAASALGYNVLLCDTGNNDKKEIKYLNVLKSNYVSGIVYNSFNQINEEVIKAIKSISCPLMFVDSYGNDCIGDAILSDHFLGMYELTKYVLHMGHERIAFIAGSVNSFSSNERLRGFKCALEEQGLKVDLDLIRNGNYSMKDSYKQMGELLIENRMFTCVICASDYMALGAIQHLVEKGYRIPEDMSVTGYDNIEITNIVAGGLTTVEQYIYEMGREAAQRLIGKIKNNDHGFHQKLIREPKLIMRNSVKKI